MNIYEYQGVKITELLDAIDLKLSFCSGNEVEYWEKCRHFVDSMQFLNFKDLTTKQRNWFTNIKDDLKKAGML